LEDPKFEASPGKVRETLISKIKAKGLGMMLFKW
jgi:hypothetical protein